MLNPQQVFARFFLPVFHMLSLSEVLHPVIVASIGGDPQEESMLVGVGIFVVWAGSKPGNKKQQLLLAAPFAGCALC